MPLRVHGHYSRAETEAAFGVLTDEAPWIRREGVLWHDLALGPSLFHWESQSTTTAASPTGQRTIHHAERGSPTEPFVCLGFASYESHERERILFVHQWRFAGGWSGRSRRRGCQAVAWHKSGVGGLGGGASCASPRQTDMPEPRPMELTAVLSPAEEGGYVAFNPETGTTTEGESIEEALANLREATTLYLEEFPAVIKGHPLVTMFTVPAHA